MNKIKYTTACPYFPEKEIEYLLSEFKNILEGRAMLSMGPNVKAFETEFAKYTGAHYAVGTNSCSAALEIALRSINIKPGDEVIVPVETFIATGSSIVREGGIPRFADINKETYALSLESVISNFSSNTKAVIIVHMAGYISPEIFEIKNFCEKNNIKLIEDAAHAPGASINGYKAGNIGHIGCFSFFPTKVITTGEGGMLTTSDELIYKRANSFRNRGLDLTVNFEQYDKLGTNNRMSEMTALMGRSQLRHLDDFVNKRNLVAKIYNNYILNSAMSNNVNLISVPKNATSSYWRYMLWFNHSIDRDSLKEKMKEDGIAIDWAYYPPLHLQPVFQKLFHTKAGQFPIAEHLLNHNICLPIHPLITEQDAEYIAASFIKNLQQFLTGVK